MLVEFKFFKLKLCKVGHSLRVTIPKPVVDKLRLKQGDVLILSVSDHEIRVRKERGRKH
jgi:AbrB family looped-hinge helix DNA binding protein